MSLCREGLKVRAKRSQRDLKQRDVLLRGLQEQTATSGEDHVVDSDGRSLEAEGCSLTVARN